MLKLWRSVLNFSFLDSVGAYKAKACQLQYDNRKDLELSKSQLYTNFSEAYKADAKTFTNPKVCTLIFQLVVDMYDEGM